MAFILVGLALAMILQTFRFAGPAFRRKRVFLLRLLFYPLIFWSPLAGVALGTMHGSESLFLNRSMARRSESRWSNYLPLGLTFLGLLLILPAFTSMSQSLAIQMFGSWVTIPRTYLVPMIVFFFTLEYLHYYFDSFLYRMRNPAVRSHLLPLMLPKLTSPESANLSLPEGRNCKLSGDQKLAADSVIG